MDHRELLKKYMRHVIDTEGVAFVDDIHRYSDGVNFSDEEVAELQKVKDEVSA